MIAALWESLGKSAGERWAATVFTPAFFFWTGGLTSAVWGRAGAQGFSRLADWFNHLPPVSQASIAILGLLVVTTTGFLIETVTFAFTRLLEGYWARWLEPLRQRLVKWVSPSSKDEHRWQELTALREAAVATPQAAAEHAALELRLRRSPSSPALRMPTRLGNVLRAAEEQPRAKYGLDPIRCWPRLWLLLPSSTKRELSAVRRSLDAAVAACLWGLLFTAWTYWAWWAAPVGIVAAYAAYRRAVQVAEDYADLMEATFDVHRRSLYAAASWPLPDTPAEERQIGEQLMEYLDRGTAPPDFRFVSAAPPQGRSRDRPITSRRR